MPVTKAVLVYQAGIANVFSVTNFQTEPEGRGTVRLMQADFAACINFSRGLAAAGVVVRTMYCNEAGDIAERDWSEDRENNCPFKESAHVVNAN